MKRVEGGLEDALVGLIKRCVTSLPVDVKQELEEALREEDSQVARAQLEAILRNVELAEEEGLPVCQDTGLFTFYVDLDASKFSPSVVVGASVRAVRRATKEVPLRPNVVHPVTRINTGDNVGVLQPSFEWSFNNEGLLEITVVAKGAGSENATRLYMLPPTVGLAGVEKLVLRTVLEAGGLPCPPTIVGVGVGGSADTALKLAKRALLRPLGGCGGGGPSSLNLEQGLTRKVNSLGIGPMGLGGRRTALAVNVEYAHTHTACLPVAVAFSCWAMRRATLRWGA
ncbi:MAG: fumarate hydratase [Candidatus Nezhaarchaeota archaeon]|nr:fumarate hydratase [Candidatus Nezhaarchaeota archaeon]